MKNRYAIILAAGQGTRMKSKKLKVLHSVCGKPMLEHLLDQIVPLNISKTVTVIGHGAESAKKVIGDKTDYVVQEKQLGTAHAVMQVETKLAELEGTTIILYGDTPLITAETIHTLTDFHENQGATATILTAIATDPTGYGRVIRDTSDEVKKIVEHKDCNQEELLITEINTGTYCFDNRLLFDALKKVTSHNAQGEFYLTDVIEILKAQGKLVTAYCTPHFEETVGINDRIQLAEAEQTMQQRILQKHMKNGVTILDPRNTYIHADVTIGTDTVIYPGSMISGKTAIGEDCMIGPQTEIVNCIIGNNTRIRQSTAFDSEIGSDTQVGPFVHIRPDSQLKNHVKIGNFVEVKKAVIGDDSKVSHLSYIGDALIGNNVNVGCGSITVNYDGQKKHQTIIEDHAFVGCNSNLIAPVTIKERAFIAAGSTITNDVPSDALAVARAKQINKDGYVKKLFADKKK